MKKIHHAWVICLASLWLYLCNVGLLSNILTIYLPFIEATGIGHSAGSAILSVRSLFSFVTTFFVGYYFRKFSLRTDERFDATQICALLGGGGHRAAAGCTVSAPWPQARQAVLDAIVRIVPDTRL